MRRFAVSVLIMLAASRAGADPKEEARPHIEAAMVAHGEGRYADALIELTTAYDLDPQPDLLYAIAQVHVKLDRCGDAISYYEKFLASSPKPGPAKAAREAIAVCKKRLGSSAGHATATETTPPGTGPGPAAAPSPAPTPPPRDLAPASGPPPWYRDVVGDALVGAGVVGGIVGVVLYSSARGKLDAAEDADTYQQSQDLVDQAHSRRTLSIVVGTGAVALIGGGLVHYYLHGKQHVEIVAGATSGGAVVGLGGVF